MARRGSGGSRSAVLAVLLVLGAIAVWLAVAGGGPAPGDGASPTTVGRGADGSSSTAAGDRAVAVEWPRSPRRVLLVGDSLSVEVAPHARAAFGADGDEVAHIGFSGTAICDWWDDIDRRLAAPDRPDLVIALFSGNALSPCMTARTGILAGILDQVSTQDHPGYQAAWRADVAALVERTVGAGVPLALVGSPASRTLSEARPDRRPFVDSLYRAQASAVRSVGYVDLDPLLTPGGRFAAALPCVAGEPSCTPGQLVPVRADDGGHLCEPGGFCHGAWRVAAMLHQQLRGR
jgi:hypothetical protein